MSIKLHGKEYIEVKDRVQAAHAEESYSMLSEETFSMGGREYVRVYIEVKGKQYIGTAECKFNANPKTPDGMSPFECGETSALGRALGFAGYGIVESIASGDEVARNNQEPASLGHAEPEQSAKIPTVKELQARCNALYPGVGAWQTMVHKALKVSISDGPILDKDMTIDYRQKTAAYLDYVQEQVVAKKTA